MEAGRRGLGGVVRPDGVDRRLAQRRGHVRRETDDITLDERAVEIEPRCRIARGERRRTVGRHTPARDPARRERVEDHAATRGRAG